MKIGILAVQGAFIEHEKMLQTIGCDTIEIRSSENLRNLNGLILPGGESTVQGKLIKELGLFNDIQKLILDGLPVLGTCAGLILLSKNISNDNSRYLQTLPITVERNAYGRQLGSFKTTSDFGSISDFDMTFIRAPVISSIEKGVKPMAVVNNRIVAVEFKNQIGLSFHPELSNDTRIMEYFISKC